ncbi:MAG: dihydropteroate synthase [Actinomycetota bacterium]
MTGSIYLPALVEPSRRFGGREFDFSRQVAVMAILNRTPDSFHDQGRTFSLDRATAAFRDAVDKGADWVDIGGVPFGVDVPDVGEQEELQRIVPLVEAVREVSDVVISVDTFRPEVARRAIASGADVVNDTTGLQDPEMVEVIVRSRAAVIIAHSLASPPRSRVSKPSYGDVVAEVRQFLGRKVDQALAAGIRPEQIIVDPGHDLNKNTLHTLELTRRLDEIASLGYPVLAATSNKDFIGEVLDRPQHARLEGTLAATVVCILQGARIVRLHDVAAGVAAVRMTEAILGWRAPTRMRHNL